MADQKPHQLQNAQNSGKEHQKRGKGYQLDNTSKQLKPPKATVTRPNGWEKKRYSNDSVYFHNSETTEKSRLDPGRGPFPPGWFELLRGESIIAKQKWTDKEADGYYDPRDSNLTSANKFCRGTLLAWRDMAPQDEITGQSRVLKTIRKDLRDLTSEFEENLKVWQRALQYGESENTLKYFLIMKESLEAIALWVATMRNIVEQIHCSHTIDEGLRSETELLQRLGLEMVGLIKAGAKELSMGPCFMGYAMAYSNLLKHLQS
jgi:hypothetical protein